MCVVQCLAVPLSAVPSLCSGFRGGLINTMWVSWMQIMMFLPLHWCWSSQLAGCVLASGSWSQGTNVGLGTQKLSCCLQLYCLLSIGNTTCPHKPSLTPVAVWSLPSVHFPSWDQTQLLLYICKGIGDKEDFSCGVWPVRLVLHRAFWKSTSAILCFSFCLMFSVSPHCYPQPKVTVKQYKLSYVS